MTMQEIGINSRKQGLIEVIRDISQSYLKLKTQSKVVKNENEIYALFFI